MRDIQLNKEATWLDNNIKYVAYFYSDTAWPTLIKI